MGILVFFILFAGYFLHVSYGVFPVVLPPITSNGCLGDDTSALKMAVMIALNNIPLCSCRDASRWIRVAYLNMTDPKEECPQNWELRTGSTIRGCGRARPEARICESVFFLLME